ncbi:DUF5707 domain-containing protein [Streptomyces albus]|uniref:Calcium-binding protein n=2 Tax=Streptomyces albus TaxID=1888 RepID=A0A8H1QUS4_9ACTN|nr:DUF5707 domain-containing protein [Streptomyces albus]TGG83489.1 calcium-binding protein [Streptomyces albus]UVN56754.1 DUF5707 domain-containing protein [Streptomyces albus]
MRMRATAAAVSGALALTALAIPAAQAATAASKGDAVSSVRAAHEADLRKVTSAHRDAAGFGARAVPDDGIGDTKVSSVVVNGGKNVALGTTKAKTVKVSFTVTDDSGIDFADAVLWQGDTFEDMKAGLLPNEDAAVCTATSATSADCKLTYTIDPKIDLYNNMAGTWKVSVIAAGKDGDFIDKDNAKSFKLQRYSKLTANAAPEPIKKGKTLTITGKLTRANWDTGKYGGYTKQKVTLQTRPASGGSYTSSKTYTSGSGSSAGVVKTTRTASKDTCYRYTFAGTSTTPSVTSSGDCVDVR